MVFGGDFRQIPPVVKHGSRAEVVTSCLNRSYLWRYVKGMKLTINMGLQSLIAQDVPEVSKFSNILLRVGGGTEPLETEDNECNDVELCQSVSNLQALMTMCISLPC